MPHLLIALLLILLLNYAVFLLAYKQQTDHYTDITYAFSFLFVAAYFFFSGGDYSTSKSFLFLMIALWALRLGIYLRSRVVNMGEDKRFINIRPYFGRFFRFFTIQGVGICLISLPFLIGFQKDLYPNNQYNWVKFLGAFLMIGGFLMEAIADYQKNTFRNDENNNGQFMSIGLYSFIRHPNYLGEILFWTGVFIFVSPFLIGWEYLSIISPIFISILLIFISGIRLLEKSSSKRYGHLDSYQAYFNSTWRLIPFIY